MNRQKRNRRASAKKKQANVEYKRNRVNKKNGKTFRRNMIGSNRTRLSLNNPFNYEGTAL